MLFEAEKADSEVDWKELSAIISPDLKAYLLESSSGWKAKNFISNFIKTKKGECMKSLVIFTNHYAMNLSIFIFVVFSSQSLLKISNPMLAVLI